VGAGVGSDAARCGVVKLVGQGFDRFGVGGGDAERVVREAGGKVGMGAGIDVRIDPQRNRCHGAQRGCKLLQALELVGRFDVEAVHADF